MMVRVVLAIVLLMPISLVAGETPAELIRRPLATRASLWRCDPAVKYNCSADGCKSVPALVWVQLDLAAPARYDRCDAKGCDSYAVTPQPGGIYTLLNPTPSTFLKVLNDGTDFVEVASLGTSVLISYGRCIPDVTKGRGP